MPNPIDTANLDIYKASAFHAQFPVTDVDGEVVALTGYSAIMEIRAMSGTVVLHTASTANGQITIDEDDGIVDLLIPSEDTEAWTFSQARYDLFVISPASNEYAVARGKIKVYPNITDPTP